MEWLHPARTAAIFFVLALALSACDNVAVDPAAEPENLSSAEIATGMVGKSGPIGSALSFDGIDDYVVVPHHPSLDLTDAFTVAAWIYVEEYVEWASVVTKGGVPDDTGHENNYTVHQSGPDGGGNPDFGTEFGHLRLTGCATLPAPLPESDSVIPLGEWHFVTVTFDGSTVSFYLDGVLDGQVAVSGPLCTNDQPLFIGVDFPGDAEYWHGMMDEVRIWNRSLSPAHVRAAMHGHASPLASALVGFWRFDEGTGTVANDQSIHGNHGELINGPTWVSVP